jgi:CRP-like cAMP-binding protein
LVKVFRKIKFKINAFTKKLEIFDYRDPDEFDLEKGLVKEINLEIDEIYEENYFGDYELLNNQKSQVTIIAYTPCQLISISKVDFAVLVPE